MPLPRFYLAFGVLVLATAAWLEFTGTSFSGAHENHGDPRSIRSNPGSYRSTYYGGRTSYGK